MEVQLTCSVCHSVNAFVPGPFPSIQCWSCHYMIALPAQYQYPPPQQPPLFQQQYPSQQQQLPRQQSSEVTIVLQQQPPPQQYPPQQQQQPPRQQPPRQQPPRQQPPRQQPPPANVPRQNPQPTRITVNIGETDETPPIPPIPPLNMTDDTRRAFDELGITEIIELIHALLWVFLEEYRACSDQERLLFSIIVTKDIIFNVGPQEICHRNPWQQLRDTFSLPVMKVIYNKYSQMVLRIAQFVRSIVTTVVGVVNNIMSLQDQNLINIGARSFIISNFLFLFLDFGVQSYLFYHWVRTAKGDQDSMKIRGIEEKNLNVIQVLFGQPKIVMTMFISFANIILKLYEHNSSLALYESGSTESKVMLVLFFLGLAHEFGEHLGTIVWNSYKKHHYALAAVLAYAFINFAIHCAAQVLYINSYIQQAGLDLFYYSDSAYVAAILSFCFGWVCIFYTNPFVFVPFELAIIPVTNELYEEVLTKGGIDKAQYEQFEKKQFNKFRRIPTQGLARFQFYVERLLAILANIFKKPVIFLTTGVFLMILYFYTGCNPTIRESYIEYIDTPTTNPNHFNTPTTDVSPTFTYLNATGPPVDPALLVATLGFIHTDCAFNFLPGMAITIAYLFVVFLVVVLAIMWFIFVASGGCSPGCRCLFIFFGIIGMLTAIITIFTDVSTAMHFFFATFW